VKKAYAEADRTDELCGLRMIYDEQLFTISGLILEATTTFHLHKIDGYPNVPLILHGQSIARHASDKWGGVVDEI